MMWRSLIAMCVVVLSDQLQGRRKSKPEEVDSAVQRDEGSDLLAGGPDVETGMTDEEKKKEEEEELELECGTDLVTESMKCPVKVGAQYLMCQCKARTNLVGRKPECKAFNKDACSGMTDEVMKKIECGVDAAFVAAKKKCPDEDELCACKAETNLIGRKPECEAVMDRQGCSELECGSEAAFKPELKKCQDREGINDKMTKCTCKAYTNLLGRMPDCEPSFFNADMKKQCSVPTDEMKKAECLLDAAYPADLEKCVDEEGLQDKMTKCTCKAFTNLLGRLPDCEPFVVTAGRNVKKECSGCNAPMFASVALILTVVLTQ